MELKTIAHFHSPFTSKFGIPKQSGLVEQLPGTITFEPRYRERNALRGIEEFDYLWLLWHFSANRHAATSLMVRPPLLGGNERVGVFASRSPFRPNGIGLSSVRLDHVEWDTPSGPVIHVRGADLMDGTPIFDIKPYVAYADCHPGARSGFVDSHALRRLKVEIAPELACRFNSSQLAALVKTLELDPRPHYQNDPGKVYGMPYDGRDIHFTVQGGTLTVIDIDTIAKT